jgi:hypothetical protein
LIFSAVRAEVERAYLAQHAAELLRAADDALLAAAGFELIAAELP